MRARGFSLLEVTISSFLLGFLFLVIFKVYQMGSQSWLKSDTNAELLGRIQTLSSRIGREVERSTSSSLSIAISDIDPNLKGCSFMSAVDVNGLFQYEPGLSAPRWSFGEAYYFDIAKQEVYVVRDPLVGRTRFEIARDYGERFVKEPAPSIRNPLPDRFLDGKPIARDIKDIEFRAADRVIVNTGASGATTTQNLGQLEITVTVEKDSYGAATPLSLSSKSYFLFRN